MISEIKNIIENYLNSSKLCNYSIGKVVEEGIRVSDKLTIPAELITGNLKQHMRLGDTVRLLRNQGGQEFYVLEVLEYE